MSAYSTNHEYDASLAAWSRARDVLAGEDAVKSAETKYLPPGLGSGARRRARGAQTGRAAGPDFGWRLRHDRRRANLGVRFRISHSFLLGLPNYPQRCFFHLDSFCPCAPDTLDPKNNVHRWHIQSSRQSPRGDCLRPRKCHHQSRKD
jgi:hypothetical protein